MNSSRKAGLKTVYSANLKMKKIICLVGAICLAGCVVSEKEVVCKKISFAGEEGVTTLYYPPPMDDGTPKTMLVRFGETLNAQTE